MNESMIVAPGASRSSLSYCCPGFSIATSRQKNWWEWAGAGAVQAFIIALYAEMYGFPLTIYLLVRFFGLGNEYVSASLSSSLVGLGETGLFIALFGEGVVHWPTLFAVGLFPVIVLVYTWLGYREEAQMIARFGDAYRMYERQVPMFIPRWGQWRRLAGASQDRSERGVS